MRLFKMRKVVDEREEMEMLKVEHVIFWIVFWALLAVIFVQVLFLGADFRQVAGEWCVFMLMAVSAVIGELKGGHFDYTSRPGWRAYLLYSVLATVCVAILTIFRGIRAGYVAHPSSFLLSILIFSLFTFAVTYLCLAAAGTFVKHRRKKLEEEYEEEESD